MSAGDVLVVDDHAAIRVLVRDVLEAAGYAVREAADGQEALRLVRERAPAVILLDIGMPVLDGPGFAAAYRRSSGPHAPIVLMTASAEATRWAAELEAVGLVGKPFKLDALLGAVQRAARQSATRAA